MLIFTPRNIGASFMALFMVVSCAPLSRTDKGTASSAKVPVLVNGPTKRRVPSSLISLAIEAAAKGTVSAGSRQVMDGQERALRVSLSKSKDVQVLRQRDLVTVTMRGEAGFDLNSAAVGQGLYLALERVATALHPNHPVVLRVEAHTDSQGSDSYNLELSRRRAEAVKNLLEQLGLSPSRMEAAGLGESLPVSAKGDEAGGMMNRRIEIKVAPRQS